MATSNLQEFVTQEISRVLPHLSIKENCRPEWLQSPNGGNLELDIYIPELNLAIEIQGSQHYRYVPFFHKNYQGYLDQLERDRVKQLICSIENIKLIELDNKQDALLFINSLIEPDDFKQKPLSTACIAKPKGPKKRVLRKMDRLSESLGVLQRSLANCDHTDVEKRNRIIQQRDNVLVKLQEAQKKLRALP